MPKTTGKVFKYLEKLQEPYYRGSWVEKAPQKLKGVRQRKPPTKYEHPTTYAILMRAGKAIERGAVRRRIRIPKLPALGTLPTGRVNALATLKDSDYLVLFHDNLFTFAWLLCKVVAASIPTKVENKYVKFDPDRTDDHLAANPLLFDRFKNFLYSYVIRGSVADTEPYELAEPFLGTAGRLLDSLEFFVMGHEYAHIIAGHLSGPHIHVRMRGRMSINEIARSHGQEFEADALGLQLAIAGMEGKVDLVWSYAGADLFFAICGIVENAARILATGKSGAIGSDSHPDAQSRRRSLRSCLPSLLPEYSPRHVQQAAELGDYLNSNLRKFWTHTEDRIRAMHQMSKRTRS